jgi:isoleucyl-tRNA synthetase
VGLAVGPEINYVYVEQNGEYLVMAFDRYGDVAAGTTILGEFPGRQVVGAEYEPLFSVPAINNHKGKKYVVLGANFVTTTEGTGIVHTAVMYGEDDFALGQKEGLPMVQLLNANGTYNDHVPEFIRGEYIKKAEKLIKEELDEKGLLYSRAMHSALLPALLALRHCAYL